MAHEQATEGDTIEVPARTIDQIRRDIVLLERELAHHTLYTRWHKDYDRAVQTIFRWHRTICTVQP